MDKTLRTPVLVATLATCLAVAAAAGDAKPANPLATLKERYATLKETLLTCPEEEFAAKRDEMLAFIANPGETNRGALVEFYCSVVRGDEQRIFDKPDCFALAEKAVGDDPAARQQYCRARLEAFRRAAGRLDSTLDRDWSAEARLAFAEEVLADESLGLRGTAFQAKVEALKQLGRNEDCVAFINGEIAKCDEDRRRVELLATLAEFYSWSARRYFSDPDPGTLEKAAEALRTATADIGAYQDKHRYASNLLRLADIELTLGHNAEARAALDKAEAADGKRSASDIAARRGNVAFAEGDYAAAADLWLPYAEKWPWQRRVNLVRALYAAGRKDEAESHLEFLSKNAGKYVRAYYSYALSEYRKSK